MGANNFLPFCPTDTGTNLPTQIAYAADSDRTNGNQPGVASSKLNNKALRQASYIASQVAQLLTDTVGADVLDDNTPARLLAQLNAQFTKYGPNITKYTSGSGNWNMQYLFMIATGSATAGATYTNNSVTYTVVTTVASGVLIKMTGNGAPAVSGTLTKASGTGDSTLTFYAVRAPLFLRVRMVGGGGGGGGSGTTGGTDAGAGGNTTFGSSLLTANGGALGGRLGSPGGVGGSASLGTGPIGTAVTGGGGGGGPYMPAGYGVGGGGGVSPFGGAGQSQWAGAVVAVIANTGSGGAGGGIGNTAAVYTGSGGGAGGFVDAIINSPSSTYAYAVGAAGAIGSAGTSGIVGGVGAAGYIEVTEHYQ